MAALRALQCVARHGSFSRAAQELRLTQPAVSMQVRLLEGRLGAPLLERVGKRAFPTPAGEVLLAHAGRAFGELDAAVELIQQQRGIVAGRVRLGTSASISIYLLPPLLRGFRARHPGTELSVVTGNAPEMARAVVRNELDIGIVSLPVRERELSVSPFYDDELVAIAAAPARGRRRPRAGRGRPGGAAAAASLAPPLARSIAPAELARHPLILYEHGGTVRRVIDEWFRRGGAAPGLPMELGNTEAIKKLVEAGLGLSVASWFSVKGEAEARTLVAMRLDPPLVRHIGVVRRRDKPRTPALEAFLAALQELRETLAPSRA